MSGTTKILSSVTEVSGSFMCCRGRQLGFCNAGLPLARFRGGDHRCYTAAVQLKRHNYTCPHAFQYRFTFSEETDELMSVILVKVKENDLPVPWEYFWKLNRAVASEVSVVAGFS